MLCHGRTWPTATFEIPISLPKLVHRQHSILTMASTSRENPRVEISFFTVPFFSTNYSALEKKFNDAEMEALRVPPKFRDYCAHLWVPFAECRNKNWPWTYRCAHESHAVVMCQVREWVQLMVVYFSISILAFLFFQSTGPRTRMGTRTSFETSRKGRDRISPSLQDLVNSYLLWRNKS